jgi:hypothetical protein
MTTSNEFYKAWLKTVDEPARLETLKSIWSNNKEFTNQIINNDNSVIIEVANRLLLNCYESNYYSLDAVLYKNEDRVPGINENTYWFREIQIAFEHENYYNKNLYQEVGHLLITRSNLRVLVSYPQNEKEPVSNYLHEIISGCSIANEISDNESFLFILGYHYEGKVEWEGWVYKNSNEKWKILKYE